MEATLSKASRVYTDCPTMATKLRAMTHNTEEQARTQKNQVAFLLQLAGRTTPKGLHCLSMRLTAEYFALQPKEQEYPNQQKMLDPDLYHFAVFSDNVLACAVVVNSTISTSWVSFLRFIWCHIKSRVYFRAFSSIPYIFSPMYSSHISFRFFLLI